MLSLARRVRTISRRLDADHLVIANRRLRPGFGRHAHVPLDSQDECQHVRVDPALPQKVTVAVKFDVLGKQLLRPLRGRVTVSGPKQPHQVSPFDMHGRAPSAVVVRVDGGSPVPM
jgi:hypothetical protein